MFRLIVIPLGAGLLIALLVYYVAPLFMSESKIVAVFGQAVLILSNALFDPMPTSIAGFLAGLNLIKSAATAGLAGFAITQIAMDLVSMLTWLARSIGRLFRKRDKPVEKTDLPSLDIDSRYTGSDRSKKVMGRGFDTIDRP